MKNKLMILTVALVAMSNVINAETIYYNKRSKASILQDQTKSFFNIQKAAQDLLSMQPKIVENNASQVAYKAAVSSFENEGGAMRLGSQVLKFIAPTTPSMLSKVAQSTKAAVTLPRVIYAGKTAAFAGLLGGLVYKYSQDQAAELNKVTPSKFDRVKAALSNAGTYVANTRVANTLVAAGSSVKANVQAHPRIATGAGLVTVAGLSYLAYNKFGKVTVKKVATPVVTATPKKAVVSTPVKAKKAKRFKRRK